MNKWHVETKDYGQTFRIVGPGLDRDGWDMCFPTQAMSEQACRVLARVFELGRKDKASEVCQVLGLSFGPR